MGIEPLALPPPSQADNLEESTRKYWSLCYRYNRGGTLLTVADALDELRNILLVTGEHRRLAQKALDFQQQIVSGGK